jgi:hypothetical protein
VTKKLILSSARGELQPGTAVVTHATVVRTNSFIAPTFDTAAVKKSLAHLGTSPAGTHRMPVTARPDSPNTEPSLAEVAGSDDVAVYVEG